MKLFVQELFLKGNKKGTKIFCGLFLKKVFFSSKKIANILFEAIKLSNLTILNKPSPNYLHNAKRWQCFVLILNL
jgi:hypothetical protein